MEQQQTERDPFSKACGYLNYSPLAKWLAYGAAVGIGVVSLALLVVLWLFTDLMVFRGRIPTFRDLTAPQRDRFLTRWSELSTEERATRLEQIGLLDSRAQKRAELDPELTLGQVEASLNPVEWHALWQMHVRMVLHNRVGPRATRRILPRYRDLNEFQQRSFQQEWAKLPEATRQQYLEEYFNAKGEDSEEAKRLAKMPNKELSERQWEMIWADKVDYLLYDHPAHGVDLRESLSLIPLTRTFADADRGILSLVVRQDASRSLLTPIVSWVAGWNGWWMWNAPGREWTLFTRYLTGLFLIAVFLGVLGMGLTLLNREAAAQGTTEAATRLRRGVYLHSFRLGTLAIRALGPGEAVSIFTRHIEAVHDALYTRLTTSTVEPLKIALLLLFALVVQPVLALAFLLFAVLIWLVGGQLATYFHQRGRQATHEASERLTIMRESLMMMRLVKGYLMEKFNQARVERQLSHYARVQHDRLRGEAIYWPLLFFLGMGCVLLLLFVAGISILNGRVAVAGMVVLATALSSLYTPITRWLESRKLIRRGRDSAAAVFRFLERRGDVGREVVGAEFLPPLTKQLELDNVSLREPDSDRMLLQDVSFTIPAGQRVGLIGADDMEKYALVYLLPRLFDPTQGEIRIDQHNLRWVTLDSLRAQIAMVLTHSLVFHDTVANNIGCGDTSFTLPQIIEAAKMAHAHHFIQKLPQGYETNIGELGHSLTASQQFRVALARAILRDPALVVIEELQGGMDEDTKSLLDDTLTRFLPGRTTIFLPHRISTIRNCDRLFLFHKGRIVATGVHKELLSSNPLYRHLHYIEFNEMADQIEVPRTAVKAAASEQIKPSSD